MITKATHKTCPCCKKDFHRNVFGYRKGDNKTQAYCPDCKELKNKASNDRIKRKRDPFYCEF